MSITYECVLLGTFDSSLLDKVRNKLRVTCDSYADLHSHEMVFTVQGGPNTTNGRMVMRRDCIDEKAKWCVVVLLYYNSDELLSGLLCGCSELSQR